MVLPADLPANVRPDFRVIIDLIDPGARVLDLGCGDGELLSLLMKYKGCRGTGVEIDEKAIYQCIAKGVTVSHGDINSGLDDYSDNRFDYVILNESLQQVLNPQRVILEALRVGKKAVVGIPNFGQITARLQLLFSGKVPVTKELPYEWFNTPNLRFFTLRDFQAFCKINGVTIKDCRALSAKKEVRVGKNLFANIGIFLLEQEK